MLLLLSVLVARGAKELTQNPPDVTALEAIHHVFQTDDIRPLRRASFEPLRRYFSDGMQKKVDEVLGSLDALIARRNQVAAQANIDDESWWPPYVWNDVHAAVRGDPLTNRSGMPDKINIGEPYRQGELLEILVTEKYVETANDGTDMGGTKVCRVSFVARADRWIIDEIVFIVDQYGRKKTTSLTAILRRETKRFRGLQMQIKDFNNRVRPAKPVSSPT